MLCVFVFILVHLYNMFTFRGRSVFVNTTNRYKISGGCASLFQELITFVCNTSSDLDYLMTAGVDVMYDYVTCFQVIEHLMNPRLFFDNLYRITTEDVILYLSYPSRLKIMWNDEEHFHEYDRLRFEYLLKKTGWKIVREKKIYVSIKPNGIRPLIRNFMPQTIIYKIVKIEY